MSAPSGVEGVMPNPDRAENLNLMLPSPGSSQGPPSAPEQSTAANPSAYFQALGTKPSASD